MKAPIYDLVIGNVHGERVQEDQDTSWEIPKGEEITEDGASVESQDVGPAIASDEKRGVASHEKTGGVASHEKTGVYIIHTRPRGSHGTTGSTFVGLHIIRYGNHASDATLARQAELFVAIFISSSRDSSSQSLNRLPSG